MEIGITPRASPVTVSSPAAIRPESAPSVQAVRTELTTTRAVTANNETQQIRSDVNTARPETSATSRAVQDAQTRTATLDRALSFDTRTNEVIFQVLNQNTGEVVRQIPEESVLKMRAIYREAAQKASEQVVSLGTSSNASQSVKQVAERVA